MNGNASRDYSRELQEKFEIYLLGLIFTVLAAAVQTAKLGSSTVADLAELSGWTLLFVSALVGLSRFEWLPVVHVVHGKTQDLDGYIKQAEQAREGGQRVVRVGDEDMAVDDAIALLQTRRNESEGRKTSLETRTRVKYQVHKWTFAVGLALMLVARGWVPARAAVESLATASPMSPIAASAVTGAASSARRASSR